MNYELKCMLCPDQNKSVYIGESSRNLYTRSREHLSNYRSGLSTSFMAKHQSHAHGGQEPLYKEGHRQHQELPLQASEGGFAHQEESEKYFEWKI